MGKVALAGGTSGVGLAFLDALEAQDRHDYILFTRNPHESPKAVVVNYNDINAIKSILEAHNIDTVISAISVSDQSSGEAQLNLITAADLSATTKRFLPSEFGADYTSEHIKMIPPYAYKLKARDALANTGLEYSIVSSGFFLDYWGRPHVPTHLTSGAPLFVDLASKFASIPGTGDQYLALSHTADVARHVVDMLNLSNWPKNNFFVSDRLTINEFVQLAEEVLDVKFDIAHDSAEYLKSGQVTLPPVYKEIPGMNSESMGGFFAMLHLRSISGYFDIDPAKCEGNEKPNVKPLLVRDIIEAWKKSQD